MKKLIIGGASLEGSHKVVSVSQLDQTSPNWVGDSFSGHNVSIERQGNLSVYRDTNGEVIMFVRHYYDKSDNDKVRFFPKGTYMSNEGYVQRCTVENGVLYVFSEEEIKKIFAVFKENNSELHYYHQPSLSTMLKKIPLADMVEMVAQQ